MATRTIADDEVPTLLTGFLLGLVANAAIPGMKVRIEWLGDEPILVVTFIDKDFSCIISELVVDPKPC